MGGTHGLWWPPLAGQPIGFLGVGPPCTNDNLTCVIWLSKGISVCCGFVIGEVDLFGVGGTLS